MEPWVRAWGEGRESTGESRPAAMGPEVTRYRPVGALWTGLGPWAAF
jgi:hypothetical protein